MMNGDSAFVDPGEGRLFGPLSEAEVAYSLSQTPTRALAPGQRLPESASFSCDNEFRLFERIGAGGQGEVWLARQEELHRLVAVKVLLGHDEESFRKEALVAGALDHPNIIPVHRMCRVERLGTNQPALAMKLARGTPWTRLIRQEHPGEGKTPPFNYVSRHLRLFIAMCNALAYAHSRGIIHRDIKPSQVIIGDFGEVYLTDWGMAVALLGDFSSTQRIEEPAGEWLPTRESSSVSCGTPAYMAPEQAEETNARIGRHTDIYLLGGVLFEILNAHPPRDVRGMASALLAIHENRHRPVPEDVPEELRRLIERCLATNPEDRPESVLDVRRAVEEYLDGVGRQEESRRISGEVARRLGTLEGDALDYETCGPLIEQINTARELWSGNSEAERLRRRLLVRQVEYALGQGDLGFARGACVGLPAESGERRDLEERIAEEQDRQKRHHRQRKLALALSLFLLAALGIGAIAFARHQQETRKAIEQKNVELAEQRDIAEQRREEAQEARADMQTTLDEVLYKLDIPLRSVDRLESLREIAQLALRHYEGQDVEGLTAEQLKTFAWTQLRLTDVFLATLELDKAYQSANSAYGLQTKAYRLDKKESFVDQMVVGKEIRSAVQSLRGNLAGAEKDIDDACRYADALAAQAPSAFHYSSLLWVSCLSADLALRRGDLEKGRSLYEEALKTRQKLSEYDLDDPSMIQTLENADSLLGLLAVKYLDNPEGLARIQQAAQRSESRRLLGVHDAYQEKDLVSIWLKEAEALQALGRYEEGMAVAEKALKAQRLLVRARPENLLRSYSLGELASRAAELAIGASNQQAAIDYAEETVDVLLPLSTTVTPPARLWELLAAAHWARGEALLQRGETAESKLAFDQAWDNCERLAQFDSLLSSEKEIRRRVAERTGRPDPIRQLQSP